MSGLKAPTSLPPTVQGFALNGPAPIIIDLHIDYLCPFSSKMFTTLYNSDIFTAYEGKVQFVMQNTPQPWHPQGVYVHEVALAIKVLQPEVFAKCTMALYTAFKGGLGKFTDLDTYDKSRKQIYAEILDVCAEAGADKALIAPKLELLNFTHPLAGPLTMMTAATQDIKWAFKLLRVRGVQVTPTCFVNGLQADVIQSAWTAEQWHEFLDGAIGGDNFNATKVTK